MIKQEDVYKIGKLGKPHGVKGELSFLFSDDVFDRVDADYLVLDIDGILVPFFMEEYRFKSNEKALVKFVDIDSEERARQLTGCEVFFPRNLSDSDAEHVSWAEIIGFAVIDKQNGQVIGHIKAIDDTTINTLFEIETTAGNDILLPAHEELIHEADMQRREIRMSIPDGLLDL